MEERHKVIDETIKEKVLKEVDEALKGFHNFDPPYWNTSEYLGGNRSNSSDQVRDIVRDTVIDAFQE